jgi:hypothetical protein
VVVRTTNVKSAAILIRNKGKPWDLGYFRQVSNRRRIGAKEVNRDQKKHQACRTHPTPIPPWPSTHATQRKDL